MVDPNRRYVLCRALGTAGAVAATVTTATSCATPAGTGDADPLVDAVRRNLDSLRTAWTTVPVVSADLRRMFAAGAVITDPVGAGRYLVTQNPVRAIALLPVRYGGVDIELPVVATFAGATPQTLRIVSLASAPANPFATLNAPAPAVESVGDASPNFQARYDRIAATGGGVLAIPAGRFPVNLVLHSRGVHLSGAGRGATQLVPRDPALPVLRAAYREGSWDYVTIANLDIGGIGGRGVGFAAGAGAYTTGDEFAGRTRFVNTGFADLTICIQRHAGQIGLAIEQCGFGAADYHLHSIANKRGRGEIMHAGILTARDCHFTGARIAIAYFDSPTPGTGGVFFDTCIMERNPGFVFFVAAFPNIDATTDFVIRDCWNEGNATAAVVQVMARREPVRYATFCNTGMVRFEGTPLGPLTLRNAVVETRNCPLDNLSTVDRDAASTLQHHNARGFGGYAPLGLTTTVAAAAQSEPPGRALTFVLPARTARVAMPAENILISLTGDAPLTLVGSVSVATRPAEEAALPGVTRSQRVALRPGMQVFPRRWLWQRAPGSYGCSHIGCWPEPGRSFRYRAIVAYPRGGVLPPRSGKHWAAWRRWHQGRKR